MEERVAIEQLKEAERERQQLDEELRMLELDEKALEVEEAESAESALRLFITNHLALGSGEPTTIIFWLRSIKPLN